MADWSDYHFGQLIDSLAELVALRYHDVSIGDLNPGLDCYKGVFFDSMLLHYHSIYNIDLH